MTAPTPHYWLAGQEMDAERMNEIGDLIDYLRNPPMCHISRQSTAQTISANTTWTTITFDTLRNSYDPYGMWNPGTPTILTCRVAGWYTVGLTLALVPTLVEARAVAGLFRNANTDRVFRADTSNFNMNVVNRQMELFLNVGDTIALQVWIEDQPRTLQIVSDAQSTSMRLRWVSN